MDKAKRLQSIRLWLMVRRFRANAHRLYQLRVLGNTAEMDKIKGLRF